MTNQTPSEKEPISQDLNDYISLRRLMMFIASTYYANDCKCLSNEDGTMESKLAEHNLVNLDDPFCNDERTTYTLRELAFAMPLVHDGSMNNFRLCKVKKGIQNKIVYDRYLFEEILELVQHHKKYLKEQEQYFSSDKTTRLYTRLNYKEHGRHTEHGHFILLKFLDWDYLFIKRSVAEDYFHYPKRFRPEGYDKKQELKNEVESSKAKDDKIKSLENELEAVKGKLGTNNKSTIETKNQIIMAFCHMIQKEPELKNSKFLTSKLKRNDKASGVKKFSALKIAEELNQILVNEIDVNDPREINTIIDNLPSIKAIKEKNKS